MRIELGANGAAQGADQFELGMRAGDRASDEIAVSPDVFGQRIDRQIGAVPEW
jgi:hypothetical protein